MLLQRVAATVRQSQLVVKAVLIPTLQLVATATAMATAMATATATVATATNLVQTPKPMETVATATAMAAAIALGQILKRAAITETAAATATTFPLTSLHMRLPPLQTALLSQQRVRCLVM